MPAYCYILKSKQLNKFYIGATSGPPTNRLYKHKNKLYGNNTFTAAADDWGIFLAIECVSMPQALSIEAHIKRVKSKKYIENLKVYPEIIERLMAKYI